MRHAIPFLVAAGLGLACTPAQRPDTVVVGRVWTGDSARPWAEAVALQGDSIMAVGDSAELLGLARDGTELVRGAFVMPGFQDDHTHFLMGGFQLASVDLRDAATPEEFIRRIAAFARTLQPGEWILGGTWDHELWDGAPLPRRDWIDSVTPDNPVFIERLDGHMNLANSRALELAGVSRATPDVPGGEIVRDRQGEPTGVLKDNAQGLVYRVVPEPSAARLDSALARAMAHAAEQGVTGVSYVSGTWPEVNAFRRARDNGTLTLRVTAYLSIGGWRTAADSLRVNGPGDDWLRVAGVKAFVDGALGSTTAWFDEPYTDAPSTSGFPLGDLDTLYDEMRQADSAGLQLAIHAIGTRANAWVLDQFDRIVAVNGPRDRRPRIEHAQHFRPADIPRVAALGVIPAMQPYHAIDDGRWAEKRIGPERIKTTYAFRSLLDAGARLAFGSDWTVAPLSPILGVYAAVTRATIDGRQPEGFVPAEKITVEEALRAYTAANAYAVFAEQRTGMLRPGMKADLVVIDRDLTAVPAGEIREARVVRTLVAGRTVFRRP